MNTGTKKQGDDGAAAIYVACLASYNAGVLHGEWIELDGMDAEDLGGEIADMLRSSPHPNVMVECPECEGDGCEQCEGTGEVPSAEEYAIHDYDGPLGPLASWFGEHPDLETLCEVVEAFEDHDPGAVRAFIGWEDQWDLSRFEESYQGEWKCFYDFAEQYADETIEGLRDGGAIIAQYFDYQAFARDLRHDYHEEDGHVFLCI